MRNVCRVVIQALKEGKSAAEKEARPEASRRAVSCHISLGRSVNLSPNVQVFTCLPLTTLRCRDAPPAASLFSLDKLESDVRTLFCVLWSFTVSRQEKKRKHRPRENTFFFLRVNDTDESAKNREVESTFGQLGF